MNIEWARRKGRFALDVSVYAPGYDARETEARFVRAVAKALGRAVLFSDCSPFPYSYFSAEPDGSIQAQILVRDDDDDDIVDVRPSVHDDPRHAYPRLTFAPDEPLPQKEPGDPDSWTHGETSCEMPVPGKPCRTFALACPRHRLAGDAPSRTPAA